MPKHKTYPLIPIINCTREKSGGYFSYWIPDHKQYILGRTPANYDDRRPDETFRSIVNRYASKGEDYLVKNIDNDSYYIKGALKTKYGIVMRKIGFWHHRGVRIAMSKTTKAKDKKGNGLDKINTGEYDYSSEYDAHQKEINKDYVNINRHSEEYFKNNIKEDFSDLSLDSSFSGQSKPYSYVIDVLYRRILRRYPDQPGMEYWINVGKSRNPTLFQLATWIKDAAIENGEIVWWGVPNPGYGVMRSDDPNQYGTLNQRNTQLKNVTVRDSGIPDNPWDNSGFDP